MRKKNYKGRCEKVSLSKCQGVCKTYDQIQMAYANMLQEDESVSEFWCNVVLDTEEYTTDFLCTKASGEQMVRECVQRSHLTKPMTVKLLDISREYWLSRGVSDWGLVIDEEQSNRRSRNKLRDLLLQNFRYYTNPKTNPNQTWTHMEAETFWELFHDYEDMGGNGYVHSEVLPKMEQLLVVDSNGNAEKPM